MLRARVAPARFQLAGTIAAILAERSDDDAEGTT